MMKLKNRLLLKPAFSKGVEGGGQCRSEVYWNIHRASSSAPTEQSPLKVGFWKKSNVFWIIFLSLFALASCGRKGLLTYPEGQKRPKFDQVIEEE
jgi:predicted small lipoprotein YifL